MSMPDANNPSQFDPTMRVDTGIVTALTAKKAQTEGIERQPLGKQPPAPPVVQETPVGTRPPPNTLSGDTNASIKFLLERAATHPLWHPQLSFKGTDPVTGEEAKGFETVSFPREANGNSNWDEIRRWIDPRQGRGNIYWTVNAAKPDNKKASKADIQAVVSLHVDLDPHEDEGQDAAEQRLTKKLENYRQRASIIIKSGGGAWVLYDLVEPILIDGDLVKIGEAESYNIALAQDLGGDNCHNIDRIARLPGTINIPNAKKLAKGRHAKLAAVHSRNEVRHPIKSFAKSTRDAQEDTAKTAEIMEYGPVERDAPELTGLATIWATRIFDGDTDGKYHGDRSRLAYAVACELVRAGLGDDFIAHVLMTTKCGAHVQEKPAYRLRRTLERARTVALDPNLKQMNDEYSAGSVGGKFRVLRWMPDARYPSQRTCEFQTKTDFCSSTVNPKIDVPKFDKSGNQVGTEPRGRGIWWLGQDHRTEFDGIDFRPGAPSIIDRPTSDGRTLEIVNMFSGFSCLPSDAGEVGCDLFLAHVHDNICDGDEKLYAYTMDWMASGVQYPEDPGRSSLSLRGDPGCGKGVFALGYGSLFGRHFLHATQREHVIGKFNSHQAECCLIFVDEALYSQIKADAQILKTLTTEKTKLLERKGIDAVPVDNYARLIFATNDPHPIMIEHNDRRYVAIYVRTHPDWADLPDEEAAPIRKAYFQPILDQMNNGAREALLGLLLKRDISKFNAEAIPATKERALQKLLSAPPGDKIVIEFAQDGRLPCCTERFDAARPYADHNRHDGLYPAMRASSGKALQYESDQDLARLLMEWKFRRDRDRYGTVWIAPPLTQLRASIARRYPAVEWDQNLTDWVRETTIAVRQTAEDVGEADNEMDECIKKLKTEGTPLLATAATRGAFGPKTEQVGK
jgi:hypothetical protein